MIYLKDKEFVSMFIYLYEGFILKFVSFSKLMFFLGNTLISKRTGKIVHSNFILLVSMSLYRIISLVALRHSQY